MRFVCGPASANLRNLDARLSHCPSANYLAWMNGPSQNRGFAATSFYFSSCISSPNPKRLGCASASRHLSSDGSKKTVKTIRGGLIIVSRRLQQTVCLLPYQGVEFIWQRILFRARGANRMSGDPPLGVGRVTSSRGADAARGGKPQRARSFEREKRPRLGFGTGGNQGWFPYMGRAFVEGTSFGVSLKGKQKETGASFFIWGGGPRCTLLVMTNFTLQGIWFGVPFWGGCCGEKYGKWGPLQK